LVYLVEHQRPVRGGGYIYRDLAVNTFDFPRPFEPLTYLNRNTPFTVRILTAVKKERNTQNSIKETQIRTTHFLHRLNKDFTLDTKDEGSTKAFM
jgi:hypothetical protein